MKISTKVFKNALSSILAGIAQGKLVVDGADLVISKDGKLMSYNGEVAVSYPLDLGAEFGVKGKDLYNFVSKVKDEEIDLEPDVEKNKVELKGAKVKATLIMQDITAVSKMLAKLKFGEEKALPKDFVEAVKKTGLPDHKRMKGFIITGNNFIATDKVRISAYTMEGTMDNVFVDDDRLELAVKYGKPTTYSIVGPWFNIGFEGGLHVSILKNNDQNVGGKPLEYEKIVGAISTFNARTEITSFSFPENIAEVAERVTTLGSVDDTGKIVCTLRVEKDKIFVSADKNTAMAEEEIAVKNPINVENPIALRIPVKTLLALAGQNTNVKVIDAAATKAFIVNSGTYTLIASCSK